MRGWRLKRERGLRRGRRSGGEMTSESSAPGSERSNPQIDRWERSIFIISIPHAAALSGLLGKFDFGTGVGRGDLSAASLLGFFGFLPMTAWWLFVVHDMLRSQLLLGGHLGWWLQAKHAVRHITSLLFPITVILFSNWSGNVLFGYLGLTLLVWWGAAWLVSNVYYLRMMNALGVNWGK